MRTVFASPFTRNLDGFASCFQCLGFNPVVWDLTSKPVNDMLHEIQPELIFIESQFLNENLLESFKDVSLVVNGLHSFPNENIICTLLTNVSPHIISNFKGNYYVMHPAADLAKYNNASYVHRFASDFAYISTDLNRPHVIPKLKEISLLGNLKVAGPEMYPGIQYLGNLSPQHHINFLKSSKVAIDFDYEILLDCAANKILCVSNIDNSWMPNDPEKALKLEEKERYDILERAYEEVAGKLTFFHRLIDIGQFLNIDNLEDNCLSFVNRLK